MAKWGENADEGCRNADYEQMAAEQCRLQHHDNDSEWCREITKEIIINDLERDVL